MPRRALITGINGQDGSFLAELLLAKGYEVHGIMRRASVFTSERIDALQNDPELNEQRFFTYWGDLTDSSNINRIIERSNPDEVYNLGAQSHVGVSFEVPEYTGEVDALGAVRLLDALREHRPDVRFYQASTSELFGNSGDVPQHEKTPFRPSSPYAAAKLYAYWLTVNYREAYGLHACNGILFNHESERRDPRFVTRKISVGVAKIVQGVSPCIVLGNLNAKRDWGYAPEYVDAMWRMLQAAEPKEYVIGTGETHSVRDFCERAFAAAGIPLEWRGAAETEHAVDTRSGEVVVRVDPSFYRPTEVHVLCADASRARDALGWAYQTTFSQLVERMVLHDLGMSWAR